jgi:uncharacterized membrane protein
MGEASDLFDAEPLAKHLERHHYDRLLMLSDGVFAIAITLLALELKIPDHWDGTVADLIRQSGRSMFGYLFGFLVVGIFWINHRRMFARLTRADMPLTIINLVLLCLVALAPAVAELFAMHGPRLGNPYSFTLFAAIGIVQLILWLYAAFIAKLSHPALTLLQLRLEAVVLAIPGLVGALLATSIALGLYDRFAGPLILVVVVPAAWLRRRLRRQIAVA